MRALLIGLILAASMSLTTGCATTGYSGGLPNAKIPKRTASGESANNIMRNWWIECNQMGDDFNSLLLLDPASRLTHWNLR